MCSLMLDDSVRGQVASLMRLGLSDYEVARRCGIARSTVHRWRTHGLPTRRRASPPSPDWRPKMPRVYAYLLGMYLGDGCLSRPWGKAQLSIYLDAAYPSVVDEVEDAIRVTMPGPNVHRYYRPNVRTVVLQSWSMNWLVAFPQHGPGKKHLRRIELVDWQREITHAHPRELLRGLIHSDGCRCINRFSVDLPRGGRREYAYVRYFFSNLSADIRRIFTDHCDMLGIRWSMSNPRNVSISPEERRAPGRVRRREDVARPYNRTARGCGGTGRRAALRRRWASPMGVRVPPSASLVPPWSFEGPGAGGASVA
jgi:hypothetical protein